jgi:SMI1 / KNR4 family (SUKH-1)
LQGDGPLGRPAAELIVRSATEGGAVDHIIAAIRQRLADPERVIDAGAADPNPPTTTAKVDAAEEALGFPIPAILRRLYTEVANGHFGPGYGLVGVDGCGTDERRNDIVALYRGQSSEHWRKRLPRWPDHILRVAYFGCAMYAAVDCKDPEYPVYLFEPNASEEDLGYANCLVPYGRGLNHWLLAWAKGENVEFPSSMGADGEPGATPDPAGM